MKDKIVAAINGLRIARNKLRSPSWSTEDSFDQIRVALNEVGRGMDTAIDYVVDAVMNGDHRTQSEKTANDTIASIARIFDGMLTGQHTDTGIVDRARMVVNHANQKELEACDAKTRAEELERALARWEKLRQFIFHEVIALRIPSVPGQDFGDIARNAIVSLQKSTNQLGARVNELETILAVTDKTVLCAPDYWKAEHDRVKSELAEERRSIEAMVQKLRTVLDCAGRMEGIEQGDAVAVIDETIQTIRDYQAIRNIVRKSETVREAGEIADRIRFSAGQEERS